MAKKTIKTDNKKVTFEEKVDINKATIKEEELEVGFNITPSSIKTERVVKVEEHASFEEMTMGELVDYKNGINILIDFYNNNALINKGYDLSEYDKSISSLNALRKYDTMVREIMERKILEKGNV